MTSIPQNDAKATFFFNGPQATGSFNQITPIIRPAAKEADLLTLLVSYHEKAHADLNTKSVYGAVLSLMAMLHQHAPDKEQSVLLQKQEQLVQYCRTCHEVYATYISVYMYEYWFRERQRPNPLENNPAYESYYRLGKRLLTGINGYYTTHAVLMALCSYCFQSRAISEALLYDIAGFQPASVRSIAFPDKRLDYLLAHLPELDIPGCIAYFVQHFPHQEQLEPLLADMQGTKKPDEFNLDNGEILIFETLCFYILERLRTQCDADCGESLPTDDLASLQPILLETVKRQFPQEAAEGLQFIPTGNGPLQRSVLLGMEIERIQFWPEKPQCRLLHPEQLTAEQLDQMFDHTHPDPSIVFETVHTVVLLDQYEFPEPADRLWLETATGLLIVLRYFYLQADDRPLITVIPFTQPDEILQKLDFENRSALYPVYGVILLSIYAQCEAAENNWVNFFQTWCWNYYTINDISLVAIAEQMLVYEQAVSYSNIFTEIQGKLYSALVFSVQHDIGQVEYMILPGTDLYIGTAIEYLKKCHPQFEFSENPEAWHQQNAGRVLHHLFSREYTWFFKNQITHAILTDETAQ
jgi:hypothetical protein